MNLRSLALQGATWVAITRVAVNLLGLISTLALARLLTPDDFGLVAISTTILAVVSSFTELPLSTALIQHNAPEKIHYDSAFTLNVIRSILVTVGVAGAAYPISIWYEDPRLFELIVALSFSSLIMSFSNPKRVLFTRELNFYADFVQGILMKLIGFVCGIAFALIYRNYWSLVIGSLSAQVAFVVISYTQLPYLPGFSLKKSRELFSFSVWLSYSQIINTISLKIDHLLVGYHLGSATLGIYSFGDNLASLPTREVTSPISQLLFPSFARMNNDLGRLRASYQVAQSSLSMIAFPIGIGFSILAHPFILFAVGEKWLGAELVIQVISAAVALQTMASPIQSTAMALGQTKALFKRDAIILFARFPFSVLGLIFGGLPGILIARAVTTCIGTLIEMLLVSRLLGLGIVDQLLANRRNFLATAFMIAAAVGFQSIVGSEGDRLGLALTILGTIAISGFVYIPTLLLAWRWEGYPKGPEREIIDLMSKLKRRPTKNA